MGGSACTRFAHFAYCLVSLWVGETASAQVVPLPTGPVVVGPIGNTDGPSLPSLTDGFAANIYTGSIVGGFIPSAPAAVVRTSTPTQFVRFYNKDRLNTLGPAVGPWIATSNSVRGLTAAQVKNILALPDMPTSVALVRVPAGTCILGGPGNPVLGNFPANPPAIPTPGPWGAAGAPQYYIVGQTSTGGCANPQNLPPSDYIALWSMGTYALAYGPNAGGGNTGAVAAALDHAIFPAPFTPMDSVYNSLDLLNFTDPVLFRSALSQLSGEINADLTSVSIESSRMFLNVLGQRLQGLSVALPLRSSTDAPISVDGKTRVWFNASGSSLSIGGDRNTHEFDLSAAAIVAGVDHQLEPDLTLGGAVGYIHSAFSTDGLNSHGYAAGYHAALYGIYSAGPLYANATAGYSLSDFDINRVVPFPGQQASTVGKANSQAFVSAVELGYRFLLSGATSVSPIAGIQVISLWQDAFSEYGGGPFNLDVAEQNLTSVRSLLGMNVTHDFAPNEVANFQLRLRLAWAHDYVGTDRAITQSFQQLSSANFQVEGAAPSRDAAVVSIGLSTSGPVRLFIQYDGQYNGVRQVQSGTAGLAFRF